MNCIINVATSGAWYERGSQRLAESLAPVNYMGEIKIWSGMYPEGCPPHSEIPYGFKPHAFKWAKEAGMKKVIWMDSSVWAQKDIQPIFDIIEKQGYMILRNGWTTGNWSTDEQLSAYNLTREEAFSVPHAMANVIGINFDSYIGNLIFEEYFNNQHLFKGAWKNENGEVSADKRVLGSRHDQTILSLIVHKYKLELTNPQGIIDYNTGNTESILLTQGL